MKLGNSVKCWLFLIWSVVANTFSWGQVIIESVEKIELPWNEESFQSISQEINGSIVPGVGDVWSRNLELVTVGFKIKYHAALGYSLDSPNVQVLNISGMDSSKPATREKLTVVDLGFGHYEMLSVFKYSLEPNYLASLYNSPNTPIPHHLEFLFSVWVYNHETNKYSQRNLPVALDINLFAPTQLIMYKPGTNQIWGDNLFSNINFNRELYTILVDKPKVDTTVDTTGTNIVVLASEMDRTPGVATLSGYDWKRGVSLSTISPDFMGWCVGAGNSFYRTSQYDIWGRRHSFAIWYRKALTGQWKVIFTDTAKSAEMFTVEEDYHGSSPEDYTELPPGVFGPGYKSYNLLGVGSNGTVLTGLVYNRYYLYGEVIVTVIGTFSNPAWAGQISFEKYVLIVDNPASPNHGKPYIQVPAFLAVLDLQTTTPIQYVTDNEGNPTTAEIPRTTYAANKPPEWQTQGAKAMVVPTGSTQAGTLCENDECYTCKADPITQQTVIFDYTVGDPVNLNNLEFVQDCLDMNIKGRGISFQFRRVYKSRISYSGPLGNNWDHSYNMRLVPHPTQTSQVILYDGSGRGDAYTIVGSSSELLPPIGAFNKIIQESDGTFLLRNKHGNIIQFYGLDNSAQAGKLAAMSNRCGHKLVFEYSANGLLSTVRDSYNRPITFQYDLQNRITQISAFTGQQVLYAYDNSNDLVSVTSSPVLATPNGNDFGNGKQWRYTYSSGFSDAKLNHNLLTILAPNEVALNGAPYLTNYYDSDDRVIRQDWGGTNASGVGSGGTIFYSREVRNVGVEPSNSELPREVITITDRSSNVSVFYYNINKQLIRKEDQTRNIRPGDPAMYVTQCRYTSQGLLEEKILPQGNRVVYEYDQTNPDPFQAGNLLSVTVYPDTRAGDQAFVKTTYQYEPVFNQVWKITSAKGNDPSFVPPNSGANSQQRFTTEYIPDYFEGGLDTSGCECGHTLRQLVEKYGIDISSVLSQLNQGDLNGDGRFSICGNPVLIRYPKATLRPDSPQTIIEGGIYQTVEMRQSYNKFSQLDTTETPEGEITQYLYYGENDPEGDGQDVLSASSHGQPLDSTSGGYLKEVISDYAHSARYRGTSAPKQISTKLRYDAKGNITEITDPRGVRSQMVYNQLNQVVEITRAADVSAASEPGLLAHAYKSRIYYDANNNVIKTEVEYRDGNNPSLPQYIESTAVYDILNKPIRTTKRVNNTQTIVTQMRYDGNENLIEILSPLAVSGTQPANKVQFVYDERDLLYQTIRAPGTPEESISTCKYDLNGNKVQHTDAQDNNGDGLGESTTFIYDGFDRLTNTIDPAGNEAVLKYDPAGNVIESKVYGSIGGPTRSSNSTVGNTLLARGYAYHDELGRVYQKEAQLFIPSGVLTSRVPILSEGDLVAGDGKVTSFTDYDRNSRVTYTTAPSPSSNLERTQFFYDGLSRLVKAVDAQGNEVSRVYDANSNVIKVTATERHANNRVPAQTFTTLNVFDSLNRLVRTTDNLGQTRRIYYDSRNLAIRTTDAQGHLVADPLGLFTGQINTDGNAAEIIHDGLGRALTTIRDLTSQAQGGNPLDTSNPSNSDGLIVENSVWDDNSRLVSLSDDKANTTSYEYDSLNRPIKTTFADNTTHQARYNKDSQLTEFIDNAGNVITNTYDALGRVVRRDIQRATREGVEGTTAQTFEYDGLSRLTRTTDNNNPASFEDDSVVERRYDSLSRLLQETQNGKIISMNWTQGSDPVDLTYPNGRRISYTLDNLNRVTSIASDSTPLANYDYLGSHVLERVYANGTRLSMLSDSGNAQIGYDALPRLVQMRHLRGSTLMAGYKYTYNRENMKTSTENLVSTTQSELYQYDSVYRIVDFKRGTLNASKTAIAGTASQTQAWQLDGVGNWAATSVNGQTQTQSVSTMNEYLTYANIVQIHSKNGNLTDDGERLLKYDFANRLLEVRNKADGSLLGTYTYDAFNRRTSKTFTRDTDAEPEFTEYTADGNTIGLWHYNESSGKVLDSSGNANHGTPPSKFTRGVQGLFNTKAADFEGRPVRVAKSSSLNSPSEQLTVETWVYLDSQEIKNTKKPKPCWKPKSKKHTSKSAKLVKHTGTIVRRPGSFKLRIQKKDLRICFRLLTHEDFGHSQVQCDEDEDDDDDQEDDQRAWERNFRKHRTYRTSVISDAGIAQDEWVHVAAVYGNGKVTLYINGEKQADQKITAGYVRKVSTPLFLGGQGFEGTLEETRLSNIARTEFGNTSNAQGQQSVLRSYFYSGWRIIEERKRVAPVGQTLGVERVTRQFVDGLGIDEHLRQDVFDAQGSVVQSLYYHENGRGDTVAVSDGAGNSVARFEYSAYGEVFHVDTAGGLVAPDVEMIVLVRYTFHGHELDEETGFYQFRHRYYDPRQGRWLSRDPLLYRDSLNTYEAFLSNPYSEFDPSGKLTLERDSFSNFIRSLEKYNLPTAYLQSISDEIGWGILSSGGIAAAKYTPANILNGAHVSLKSDIYIKTRQVGARPGSGFSFYRLPTIEEFLCKEIKERNTGAEEFGQLMHELWHAYLEQSMKPDAALNATWKDLVNNIPKPVTVLNDDTSDPSKLFVNLSSPKDLDEYLDEAVGMKIQNIFKTFLELEARKRLGEKVDAMREWKKIYTHSYQGYLSEDGYKPGNNIIQYGDLFKFLENHILENKFSANVVPHMDIK